MGESDLCLSLLETQLEFPLPIALGRSKRGAMSQSGQQGDDLNIFPQSISSAKIPPQRYLWKEVFKICKVFSLKEKHHFYLIFGIFQGIAHFFSRGAPCEKCLPYKPM